MSVRRILWDDARDTNFHKNYSWVSLIQSTLGDIWGRRTTTRCTVIMSLVVLNPWCLINLPKPCNSFDALSATSFSMSAHCSGRQRNQFSGATNLYPYVVWSYQNKKERHLYILACMYLRSIEIFNSWGLLPPLTMSDKKAFLVIGESIQWSAAETDIPWYPAHFKPAWCIWGLENGRSVCNSYSLE